MSGGPAAAAPPALLVLEDGATFHGTAFGAEGETFGEMVFNTGMTGYQETLTDPSYCRQIVAMTAPHIGNTGVNDEDPESRRIWVSGYVIREPARIASSWRAVRTLEDELRAQHVTGIAISGTRALTRHLRDRGAMRAAISTIEADPGRLLRRVLASQPMTGADLAREVSTTEPASVKVPVNESDCCGTITNPWGTLVMDAAGVESTPLIVTVTGRLAWPLSSVAISVTLYTPSSSVFNGYVVPLPPGSWVS